MQIFLSLIIDGLQSIEKDYQLCSLRSVISFFLAAYLNENACVASWIPVEIKGAIVCVHINYYICESIGP